MFDTKKRVLLGVDKTTLSKPKINEFNLFVDNSNNSLNLQDSSGNIFPVSSSSLKGLLIDGDSFAARNNNELSPLTVASQSGGIATVSIGSATPIPGQRLKLGNFTDNRWNGVFTILTSSGTSCTFAIDPNADAVPSIGTRAQAVYSLLSDKSSCGDLVWAEMVNGVNYSLIANVAYGARVLTEILADAPITIGNYRNCLIDFNGGTNDPKNGVATTVSSAAMESYLQLAKGWGHVVLVNTVPALAGAANTTSVQQLTLALNKEYKRLALKYNMPLFDKYAAVIDPTTAATATGNFDTSDNIHLTPTACKLIGTAKASIYAKYVPTSPVNLPATTQDVQSIINTSMNILDGFFSGTGGTGGAGQIATGCTLTPTTITVTGSKGVGTVGATQILTLSVASGSFLFSLPNKASSLIAGHSYEFVGKFSLANFAAGIRCTIAIITDKGEIRALSTRSSTMTLPLSGTMIFRSEIFTILAGAVPTSFIPRLTVVTTGVPGGTETITLEDWAINDLGIL
jgi:hypothetical protein